MRVGVVGVGSHAVNSLYPNLPTAGLELVATCARRQDQAEAAAARWGAKHAYDDPAQMIANTDLDGVVVCVPQEAYRPILLSCIEGGLPVYSEKPAATSYVEASELADLSETKGVEIVVGYMKRFAPSYRTAHALVRSEHFGAVSLGVFTFAMGPWLHGSLSHYIIDNPVHHLDLARFLLGEFGDLHVEATTVGDGRHAIAVSARVESGAVCTLNFCTTASWEQRNEYVEVYGEGNAVWIDNLDTCTYRPTEGPEQVWRPNYTVGLPKNLSPSITGFVPALTHFRKVVTNGAPNESSIRSAANTLLLAERILSQIQDLNPHTSTTRT